VRRPLVLFDLGDTLVDRQAALADWATAFVVQHGLRVEAHGQLLRAVAERASPSTFDAIRARHRLPAPTVELWRAYMGHISAALNCPADILDGLDELRGAGWRVGIATNGGAGIQRAKLRATRIAEHVDGVCISEEAGVRKPQREHFARAATRCGTSLDEGGWMVGDNPVTDIGGGHAAGLRTIWVANGRSRLSLDHAPDHTVSRVRGAIDFLLLPAADTARSDA
jgi:HAD superfamily hydrolase (TIGR01549 family)